MKLLAIDTATELCSVALFLDGTTRERSTREPRAHASNVLPFVAQLMADAGLALHQLDGIAFGCGPGGFTGLRVASSVTQGLAFGAKLPVVAVSDLAALAYAAFTAHGAVDVAVALDARMSEIYYGAYRCSESGVTPLVDDALAAPENVTLPAQAGALFAAGAGWPAYWQHLPDSVKNTLSGADDAPPSARAIAALGALYLQAGQTIAPEYAIPVYLRDNVARKTAQRGRQP